MCKPELAIFTDGGCRPNPGLGGWGVYITFPNGKTEEYFGHSDGETTTNNRMELTAFYNGIRKAYSFIQHGLHETHEITIYCDSNYVKLGVEEWLQQWFLKNPSLSGVKNSDLWLLINDQIIKCAGHINIKKVKGHSGDIGNAKADDLATKGVLSNVPRD